MLTTRWKQRCVIGGVILLLLALPGMWLVLKIQAGRSGAAALALGENFAFGRGVPQDFGEAMKWYQQAAAAGNTEAMLRIGGLYARGQGVEQDRNEAMKWYRKAADAGNGSAPILMDDLQSEALAGGVVLGGDAADADTEGGKNGVGPNPVKAAEIALSDKLPREISRTRAGRLKLQDAGAGTGIIGGEEVVAGPAGGGASGASGVSGGADRIDHVALPTTLGALRVRIDAAGHTLLGGAVASAKMLNGLSLIDDQGDQYYPTCWVVYNRKTGEQRIHVGGEAITSGTLLPLNRMGPDESLYVYIPVPRGTTITAYALGAEEQRPLNLTVP